jgi:ATP-dependent exoDNAse (exonuclease V) beta subunit
MDASGNLTLLEPSSSLLATAWPALQDEVRASFEQWKATQAPAELEGEGLALAASAESNSAESNLLVMPPPLKPTLLRRLPLDFAQELGAPSLPRFSAERVGEHDPQLSIASPNASSLYRRHEGGLLSRALGTAVHTLLEEYARQRSRLDEQAAHAVLAQCEPRLAALVRAHGIDRLQAAELARQALALALAATQEPIGAWILSPHTGAASEAGWSGVVSGAVRTVRPDRVFQAGLTPGSEGNVCWWIIDYKTAQAESADAAASLPELRRIFAPQLEAYALFLRRLHGEEIPIHIGLYYPRVLQLDWWER